MTDGARGKLWVCDAVGRAGETRCATAGREARRYEAGVHSGLEAGVRGLPDDG